MGGIFIRLHNIPLVKNTVVVLVLFLSACGNTTETMLREGRHFDSLCQYKEAIAIYDKILIDNPNQISALLNRAADKGMLDDDEAALVDLKHIMTFDSTNTLALFNLGIVLGNLRRYEESIDAFDKAADSKGGLAFMELVPNGFADDEGPIHDVPIDDIFFERGLVHYNADSIRKAYFDFTHCIERESNLGESYYYRAKTYIASHMLKEACEDLTMAAVNGQKKEVNELLGKYCK
jgi:tetratricopeptide (TPR) repeat protein